MSTVQNKANIESNRRKIFELENQVLHNRALAHATRSLVIENQAVTAKNYQAAFAGNRQLANQNTDDAFRNRSAIARNIKATTPVEVNYKEALANKVKLEFLEHRARLNERVIRNTETLASVNRQLIDVNRSIMDGNEEIAQFNAKIIASNAELLANGVDASKATPESNAELIAANKHKIEDIKQRSNKNKERINELFETANRNRASVVANGQAILDRRERILANHAKIVVNQGKVADFIAKL